MSQPPMDIVIDCKVGNVAGSNCRTCRNSCQARTADLPQKLLFGNQKDCILPQHYFSRLYGPLCNQPAASSWHLAYFACHAPKNLKSSTRINRKEYGFKQSSFSDYSTPRRTAFYFHTRFQTLYRLIGRPILSSSERIIRIAGRLGNVPIVGPKLIGSTPET